MAGKSGRSINNVPENPSETHHIQLGRHPGHSLYPGKYFLRIIF